MSNEMTIVKGEIIALDLYIVDSENRPYDLNAANEIIFCMADDNGDSIEKKLSVGATELEIVDATLGEIKVKLLAADTELLETGRNQSFCVKVSDNADLSLATVLRIANFERVLNVIESCC